MQHFIIFVGLVAGTVPWVRGLDGFCNGYFNDGVFSAYGAYEYDDDQYVYYTPATYEEVQASTYQEDLKFFSVYYNNY